MAHVLAITFDGVLQPLAYSQVVRVAIGLARSGLRYSLVSLERDADLAREADVDRLRSRLADEGIDWRFARYDTGGGARSILTNMRTALSIARASVARAAPSIVHARALHGALVARALRATAGVPYLFDARSYWVDEQVAEGRRFTTPASYRAAKAIEGRLFTDAAGVVTLTELQAGDLRARRIGPITCIPTCADYDDFVLRSPGASRPSELDGIPDDARLFGIVGALNRSYRIEETVALAKHVLDGDPRFHLLVLTAQVEEYTQLLEAHGVPAARRHVRRLPHDAMPRVLPFLEWGALLLDTNFAKRASMPTKLAEFFAAGVRPVHHGCNAEVGSWVERAGSGIVLPDVSEASLAAATQAVIAPPASPTLLSNGRESTRQHFALDSAIRRYRAMLDELIRTSRSS